MSTVVFLAPVQDTTTPATVYGAGHTAVIADEAMVAAFNAAGKVAMVGAAIRAGTPYAITTTAATIPFTVDQACTAMKVDYGTTTAYGSSQAATPASGTGAVVANLSGLTTGTTYNYRISVTVGTAVSSTPNATFRTL